MQENGITSLDDLGQFFTSAFKPPDQWRMGMEFEKIGVHPETGRALPFSGPNGVEEILKKLSRRFGWVPLCDGDRTLGLERGESRITLEPGAQLELSAEPCRTLHDLAELVNVHLEELREVTDPSQVAWLGLGSQPLSSWDEIELLPKKRYAIMDRYLPRQGTLGRDMMRTTAALQLNLDYEDEKDAMEKYRLTMAISPLLTAVFANSCISGGKPNGFLSRRAYIWQHTDTARCGFVEKLYHPEARLRDYVDYALDVPMLFLARGETWVETDGTITFRQFLDSGFQGHTACWDDWVLHLSSIFTEARFKPFLEARGADCVPPGLTLTFPALLKGILYDRQARKEACNVVRSWRRIERQALNVSISRKGPAATIQGQPLMERIREIVRISREGLVRCKEVNARGQDESVFLDPLQERLEEGWDCPSREVLALWHGDWRGNLGRLLGHCRF